MNFVKRGSFEYEDYDEYWNLDLPVDAHRSTDYAKTGLYSLHMRSIRSDLGSINRISTVTQSDMDGLILGRTYEVNLEVNPVAVGNVPTLLGLSVDKGDGGWTALGVVESTDMYGDIWVPKSYTFAATGPVGRLRLQTSMLPRNGSSVWYIDDVRWGDHSVAVKLAERIVDSVISLLQTNLPSELTAIDTERDDDITMDAPVNGDYFNRDMSVIQGRKCAIEVFEGSFDLSNPYTDSDAQRALYVMPITIRVTYWNTSADKPVDVTTRMRRYSVGIFNCFNKNPEVVTPEDATYTMLGAVKGVTPPWEATDVENGSVKTRIQLSAEVRCEEVQT